jgi:hypothetical protein
MSGSGSYYSYGTSSDDGQAPEDDLILTIDLNTAAAEKIVQAAKRATTSNFQGPLEGKRQTLDIAASTIITGVENRLDIRVIKTSEPASEKAEAKERWVWVLACNFMYTGLD